MRVAIVATPPTDVDRSRMLIQFLQKNADYYADDVAIVYGEESITHAALYARVCAFAQKLRADGIERGDSVALIVENSPEMIVSFFAVAACGATNVPLSPDAKPQELTFYFGDAPIARVVADKRRLKLAEETVGLLTDPVPVLCHGEAEDGVTPGDGDFALLGGHPDSDVVHLYSSGATGLPKRAPRTVLQYWWESELMVSFLELTRDDVIFCAIPLFHNYGLVECMLAAAHSGARLVILPSPTPFILRRNEAIRLIERQRATVFPGVPFLFQGLAESSMDGDFSSLRLCYAAAAVLTKAVFDRFKDKFDVPIRRHYGCAEVGTISVDLDPEPGCSTSVGDIFPGVDVRILGADGQPLPAGEQGEVVLRSRAMTRGYEGPGELNERAFVDGYFRTGDLGMIDARGKLHLLGREKFIIDIAGQKVDPVEIEETLARHPCVQEAVVYGEKSGGDGTAVVKAGVVVHEACDPAELIAFCGQRLTGYKVPQEIEFIDSIPKDSLGKILRKKDDAFSA